MTKRMLIDATHAEETRVVVLDGNRLEDFDVETSTKRQLKGNIYLAKVVRVEPSLQACFVEYGGNRHGFLAFSEIHPDYYQIPVADRQRLIEMEEEEARREEEEAERELATARDPRPGPDDTRAVPVTEADAAAFGGDAAATGNAHEAATAPASANDTPEPPQPSAQPESAETTTGAAEPEGASAAGAAASAAPEDEAGDASAWLNVSQAQDAPQPPASAEPIEAGNGSVEPAPVAAVTAPVDEPDQAPAAPAEGGHAQAESAPPAAGPAPQPEAIQPEATQPEHPADDDPPPRATRAQPLIIESETISGPVEDVVAHDDADIQGHTVDADAEHEFTPDAEVIPESPPPETVGGESDGADEQRERRIPPRFLRNYKIQEVIRRRQILLVQVVKEERGTKGAALTTYLSLAGRFGVLMPNSPRGGGISRKITSAADRRRLKEITVELEIPKGMGLIVRTAGANRPKAEIKRDCEYLLRLWDDIREHTLKSVAPALIYEEASLIKRAIRDVYSRDIDEIQVDGENGWRAAHEFMRMLMPSHAKKVQLWRDQSQPLFSRYQVEAQLDGMLQPIVQLRSGGYLVINQTEALVAIDVNSGRSTRERGIEETALRTNLEAADEVARQLRLRDLAGLIVIDLIDMESKKHNAMVERRIKEALKNDRARIQVGHISHFGLLEMSRQRLRPSLAETSFILCPHCGGTGHVRSTESAAIHVLRGIEEEGSKRRAAEIVVYMLTSTALYMLNHKRDRLAEIETRYGMRVTVTGDETQLSPLFRIDRVRPQTAREVPLPVVTPDLQPAIPAPAEAKDEEDETVLAEDEVDDEETESEETAEQAGTGEADGGGERSDRRRRRRRRRRGGRPDEGHTPDEGHAQDERHAPDEADSPIIAEMPQAEPPVAAAETEEPAAEDRIEAVPEQSVDVTPEHRAEGMVEQAGEDDGRGRRRGRRGGRRRSRRDDAEASPYAAPGAEQPDVTPVYVGPTPADPFGGQGFDIFDALEQAEAAAARSEPATPTEAAQPEPAAHAAQVEQPAPAEHAALVEPAAPAEHARSTDARSTDDGIVTAEGTAQGAVETTVAAPPSDEAPEHDPTPVAVQPAQPAEPDVISTGAPASAMPEPVTPPPVMSEPVAPEPVASEPVMSEPVMSEPVVAPAIEPTPGAQPAYAAPDAANDVAPEPTVKPILVGSEEEPAERKRGWWRK